jgi:hypothetical protein
LQDGAFGRRVEGAAERAAERDHRLSRGQALAFFEAAHRSRRDPAFAFDVLSGFAEGDTSSSKLLPE